MLDMCKYNMASQHDSTTQVFYSTGPKERDITYMGLKANIQSKQVKHKRKLNMSEYRQL